MYGLWIRSGLHSWCSAFIIETTSLLLCCLASFYSLRQRSLDTYSTSNRYNIAHSFDMDFSLPHFSNLSLGITAEDSARRVSAAPIDTPLAPKKSENSAPAPPVPRTPNPLVRDASPSRSSAKTSPGKRFLFKRRSATSEPPLKKLFSLSNIFKRRSRSEEETKDATSRHTRDPSAVSTEPSKEITIGSPLLQARRRQPDTVPDLEAVNRALSALPLRTNDSPSQPPRLPSLGFEIRNTPRKYRALLREAMHARSENDFDLCRQKCIAIINGRHAPVEMRIYAYNILSTLAGERGRAEGFLRESERLIRENVGGEPGLERLLGVVQSLRERAREGEAEFERSVSNEGE